MSEPHHPAWIWEAVIELERAYLIQKNSNSIEIRTRVAEIISRFAPKIEVEFSDKERSALTQAIFTYRALHTGYRDLTSENMFGDMVHGHSQHIIHVEAARDKLKASGLVDW